MTEQKTPHPLAEYISNAIHGDDDDLSVYGTSISSDGLTVYIEGEHISNGEFCAEARITSFEYVGETK